MKIILLLSLFCSFSASAVDPIEVDYIRDLTGEEYQSRPQLHRGEGEHQCQSEESIGHKCKNLGINFTDCNMAFFKLKADDCCSGSAYGGRSISFKLTKCTKYL